MTDERADLPFIRRRKPASDQPSASAPSSAWERMFAPKAGQTEPQAQPANDGPPSGSSAFQQMFKPKPASAPAPTPREPQARQAPAPARPKAERAPRPARVTPEDYVSGIPELHESTRRILDREDPVVALTRAQSGIGVLTFTIGGPEDLLLGAAYEDEREHEFVLLGPQEGDGPMTPVIVSPNRRRVTVALRNIERVSRFLIFATALSPQTPWRGAVTATTVAGGQLVSSLEHPEAHESSAVFTGFFITGRLVLRAEGHHEDVPLKRLSADYGYTEVAWRTDRDPL